MEPDGKLERALGDTLCDGGLLDAFAEIVDYDRRWGGRSPKGPPPREARGEDDRAHALVRDAVAASLAGHGVLGRPWLDLGAAEREALELALVSRLMKCGKTVAALEESRPYGGFSAEEDLPFLARVVIDCLDGIEAL